MKRGFEERQPKFRGFQKQAVKYLRDHLTSAEQLLWQQLRDRRCAGLKFRRQHPIGKYIVDFYCDQLKLIIEIDGSIHEQLQGYDNVRQKELSSLGFMIIRFTNLEIVKNMDLVLTKIKTSPPAPLQASRE
jgi:very-short-patch-repair endonuclease